MKRPALHARLLPLLVLLGASACGTGASTSGAAAFEFGVTVSGAIADQASQFQVALIANGSKYDCANLQRTCLNANGVPDSDFVRLTNSSGQQQKILVVPNTLADGGTSDDLTLENLSPGKDFALLVQAVDSDQLLGSGCKYLPEIRSGTNEPALIRVTGVDAGTVCDPAQTP